LARGVWNVPPEVRKLTRKQLVNARTDVVHLPPQALRALERLRQIAPSSPWVLASPMDSKTGHVAENAVSRGLKDMQRARAFGEAPLGRDTRGRPQVVRPHDFRRSLRSIAEEKPWGENGRRPSPMALELALGHTLGDKIMRTYNLATFDDERAGVLRHWCAFLDGLAGLTEAGVVNLDAKRA
jgi:integrase